MIYLLIFHLFTQTKETKLPSSGATETFREPFQKNLSVSVTPANVCDNLKGNVDG